MAGRGRCAHLWGMTNAPADPFAALSDALAARVAAAAPLLAAVNPGRRTARTAILWRPGVLVTSEQGLPPADTAAVTLPGGVTTTAHLAGRDPGTNVAVFRLDEASGDGRAPMPSEPVVGALALVLGAAPTGDPTARLALIQRVGPAWDSMAGGRVDRLIRLDVRLPNDEEGGPVLDAAGRLLGMSTLGPRRRVLVIPTETVERVVSPILEHGHVQRGWLGIRLQPVALPDSLQGPAGQDTGLMVADLIPGGPAILAGVLPGDILLAMDATAATQPRALLRALSAGPVGQVVSLRLMRGGQVITVPATVGAHP